MTTLSDYNLTPAEAMRLSESELSLMPASQSKVLRLARELAQEMVSAKPERALVDAPAKVADVMRGVCATQPVETFYVCLVNARRQLIKHLQVTQGTLDTLLVHPREVFRAAILANASAVILVHNHPSGDPTPSEADVRITRELVSAGKILRIEVLDHIIMGQASLERSRDFVSLRELGYFC